ncbi:MAG: copper chaperone PCu(A)C [Ilumatobacteraceae bacterium]
MAVLGACGGSSVEGVQIDEVWARPTPAGAAVAAVYFEIEAGAADRMVAARVDPAIAAGAELHATTVDDTSGEVEMRQLDGVPVEPGSALSFEPGGNHVMLVDVVRPLVAGTTFALTLDLERAGPQVVTVSVRDGPP